MSINLINNAENFHLSSQMIEIRDKINSLHTKYQSFFYNLHLKIEDTHCFNFADMLPQMYSDYGVKNNKITQLDFLLIPNLHGSTSLGIDLFINFYGKEFVCNVGSDDVYSRFITDEFMICRRNKEEKKINHFNKGYKSERINHFVLDIIKSKTDKLKYNVLDSDLTSVPPKSDFIKNDKYEKIKPKVSAELESFNLMLDKTIDFYNGLYDMFLNKNASEFVAKYKVFKEIMTVIFIFAPEDLREDIYLQMKRQDTEITLTDIENALNLYKNSFSPDEFYYENQKVATEKLKEDIKAGKYDFNSMNSIFFAYKLKEDLKKENTNMIKRAKV